MDVNFYICSINRKPKHLTWDLENTDENTLEISQLLQQIDDLNAGKKDLAPEFHSAIESIF